MTELPPPSGPPPGWYRDPTPGTGGFRWWDGASWTDQWSEAPAAGHEGLTPVGEWINEVLRVLRSRAGHYFPLIVTFIIPTMLLNGLTSWFAFHDLVVTTDANTGDVSYANPGAEPLLYAASFASFALLVLAVVTFVICCASQTQRAIGEEPEMWSESLQNGLRRLPRASGLIIGLIVVAYALALGAWLAPAVFILAVVLWAPLLLWVGGRLTLTTVVVAVAASEVSAMRTSWRLTRGHFFALLGRMGMLTFFSVSLLLLMQFIATPFIAIGGGSGTSPVETDSGVLRFADLLGDNAAVFAIGQLFSSLGNGIAFVMWAIGFVLVYRDLSGPLQPSDE